MSTSFRGVKIEYRDRECVVRTSIYRVGGGAALLLVDLATGKELTRLSVNRPDLPLAPDEVVLRDYGARDGIREVLEDAGVVQRTGRSLRLGKLELPICKVLAPELNQERDRTGTSGQLGRIERRKSDERER